MRTYEGWLKSLPEDGIFVFGSNEQGIHGAGNAAAAARYFGAKIGVPRGLQGQSYAVVTTDLRSKDVYPLDKITAQIGELYQYAKDNPKKDFYVGYSADGQYRSGYNVKELAYMFAFHPIPENIIFEKAFWLEVKRQQGLNTEL